MRIAIVAQQGSPLTPSPDPHADAQASAVTSLARTLARQGHRITVYARRDAQDLPDSAILARGVTVEHLTAGPQAQLAGEQLVTHVRAFSDQLAKRWSQKRPDIAHAHSWTSGLAALAAARGTGVRVVQSFGSLAAAERRHGLASGGDAMRLRLEACIAKNADAVLASTTAEVAELVRMGIPRGSITVVPPSVDTSRFRPDGAAAERAQRPRLLAVAPLHADQRLDRLVRVLAALPGTELIIAGGPAKRQLRTNKAYRRLMELARELGVQRRLTFTGRVRPADLPTLLRSADLLISAAPYDPAGAVTIAAMACGTPAAASAVGGNRDAILDETTGLLVAPGRPDLLARRVRRLLAAPMRLEAFGIAAADRAAARYCAERIGRETAAVYERCLMPAAQASGAAAVTVPAPRPPDPDEELLASADPELVAALA
jgi:glycosyltransferase involved in cell wall biosynthesis